MTKHSRQINARVVLKFSVIIAMLLATPAAAQEATAPEAGGAQPAAAPVETPPPSPSEEAQSETAPAPTEQAEGPVAESGSAGDEVSATADTEESADEAEEEETPRYFQFGHRFQGGIGLYVGSGYFFEVAYAGDYCYMAGESEPSVCHGRAPVFLDFQASFGVTDSLEVMLEYRLGLLEESFGGDEGVLPTTSRPMAFGLGVRYFIGATNRVKAFIGALLDIDFTKGLKVDVFIRPIFGMQVEIVRWVAFFIQASVNVSFVRTFGVALDAGGGFQFRFP